ncbi:dihydroxyacetone kinase family protein [Actinotignum sp. GS-2025a]|uniref:dihydroxyacetone kinase family protein n=1 Tax=unclassified Actinotignum TaxID=2632702 RepID=UPI003F47F2F2
MTFIYNDPKQFPAEALAGFIAANERYVEAVHGGVVRSTTSPEGEVALVIGGGSGHYPAFPGWVGPGMAHGCVCGNIFASPSQSQVTAVSQAADNGGGVLLMYGNYAGDVLHFGKAASIMRADGLDVREVQISDDVASGTPEKHRERRGIAGDLFVVKVTGGAIAAGYNLDEAERIGWHANDSTRTLGVAFTGCTLPGAGEPLFTVPDGKFALGLGIHGEPGISEHAHATADELAALLVDGVLAEEPERREGGYNGRVTVIVNGLGGVKYEEMFVLYHAVSTLLAERGLEVVAPVVGEQVTSLDMAGVSLTVAFLDEELEKFWLAGADTPAFRTGNVENQQRRERPVAEAHAVELSAGAPESAAQAERIATVFTAFADAAIAAEADLGKLDSIAGDGDHGQGMTLGSVAARDAVRRALTAKAGAASLVDVAGKAWSEGAGGTSGALWGDAICQAATHLDNGAAVSVETLGAAVVDAARNVARDGGAVVGDKTMVDATEPFADALEKELAGGAGLKEAWTRAAEVARQAAEATAELAARKGRAKTHGDASLGHPDPGAVSFALLMAAAAEAL